VIASAVGGLPEQIRDGETGVLVRPADPDALARAIIALADDPARRTALGAAARAFVRANFTHEMQARGLRDAYLAAVARRLKRS
jgi:glycosyltransferase involved in cell wall biosynthesis